MSQNIFVLFLSFLKIGTFTFGGGYSMIALIKNEFVTKKQWISNEMFFDMIALSESTPGPIAINSATYIGYHIAGFRGALISTIAVCIPSFTIIYFISSFFEKFIKFTFIEYAFDGIQACVVYLIFSSGIQMIKRITKSFIHIAIVIIVFISMLIFSLFAIDFSTILYILICGGIGVIADFIKQISYRKNK